MKRVFTLALALSLAVSGMAQHRVQNRVERQTPKAEKAIKLTGLETYNNQNTIPAQTRSMLVPEEIELGYTTYDWQTNAGMRNQTVAWEDGFAAACWTTASNASFTDRGTGIASFDPATGEWTPSEGRVESEKTGFGTIARYGANGLVVAAHTATACAIYINEDFRNGGVWEEPIYLDNTYGPSWPVVQTSGANHDIIHVLATASGFDVAGVFEPLIYFQFKDGDWTKQNVVLDPINADHALIFSSNEAHFLPIDYSRPNRVAAVINSNWCDGKVIYSDDNGETWDEVVYYNHPGFDQEFPEDQLAFLFPRWVDAYFDANNKLHIAYEFNGTNGSAQADIESGTSGYYPTVGGVAYWDETLPLGEDYLCVGFTGEAGKPFVMDSMYLYQDIYASWYWSDATHEEPVAEYCGFLPPMTNNGGEVAVDFENGDISYYSDYKENHGKYNQGIMGMPTILQNPATGAIYIVYISMTPALAEETYPYSRLLGTASYDGGRTWENSRVLLNDFMNTMDEMVYPQFVPYVYEDAEGYYAYFIYQNDMYPGAYVQNDDAPSDQDETDNTYRAVKIRLDEETWAVEEVVGLGNEISIYPNPVNGTMNVTLNRAEEVVIYNMVGQKVASFNGNIGVNSFDASNLNSGIYFLQAGSDTQKFIVK